MNSTTTATASFRVTDQLNNWLKLKQNHQQQQPKNQNLANLREVLKLAHKLNSGLASSNFDNNEPSLNDLINLFSPHPSAKEQQQKCSLRYIKYNICLHIISNFLQYKLFLFFSQFLFKYQKV